MNGLQLSLSAIETALQSTSSTGVEERTVLELVTGIEAFSAALYGSDLSNTIIQTLSAQLVEVTIVSANIQISDETKVR